MRWGRVIQHGRLQEDRVEGGKVGTAALVCPLVVKTGTTAQPADFKCDHINHSIEANMWICEGHINFL